MHCPECGDTSRIVFEWPARKFKPLKITRRSDKRESGLKPATNAHVRPSFMAIFLDFVRVSRQLLKKRDQTK